MLLSYAQFDKYVCVCVCVSGCFTGVNHYADGHYISIENTATATTTTTTNLQYSLWCLGSQTQSIPSPRCLAVQRRAQMCSVMMPSSAQTREKKEKDITPLTNFDPY